MRILVTGGAGFIGGHVVEHFLKNTNYEIVTLDRLDISGNPQRLVPLMGPRLKFMYWDLKSPISSQLADWIGPVDWVIHIAAATHVDRSIVDPMSFVMDNVVATVNCLEFAKRAKAKFFYFSTDEVFGPAPNGTKYKEWDRYNSGNPYSASKAGAEEMCLAYANTYKMDIIVSHCHDAQTRAVTPSGAKSVDEISIGDEVFGLGENGHLVKTKVLNKMAYHYIGPMVQIKSARADQLVTPGHRVMCSKAVGSPRRYPNWEYIEADMLLGQKGRFRIPTTGTWVGAPANPVRIPRTRKHWAAVDLRPIEPEAMANFLGWFVSEGCATPSGNISISQKSLRTRKKIAQIMLEVGLKPRIDKECVQA